MPPKANQKQIDVIIGKYDENKLVTFPEIHEILKNRFGDAALKKSKYKDHKCDDDKDFMKLFEYDDTMAGKESFFYR
uniref:EF-hand domain-containing protein n=1 Tax=Strongyloides venezuelensis TaxID=75913 RepID=A0A0K0F432_STRVS